MTLSPEYGYELPLEEAEWWQLDLPRRLLDRLADWQATFEEHSNFGPWADRAAEQAWLAEGHSLADELRRHLPSGVRIEDDFEP